MVDPRRIRVMISSRSATKANFPDGAVTLRELREELCEGLEKLELFGSPLFEVWINEKGPPKSAKTDAWEESLRQIRRADVIVVLYNGDSGWASNKEEVGICHAELMEAMNTADHKVRLVSIVPKAKVRSARHRRFQEYVAEQHLDYGREVHSRDELWAVVGDALRDALGEALDRGVTGQGGFVDRSSLQWDLLDLAHRRLAMSEVMRERLLDRSGAWEVAGGVAMQVWGRDVVFRCDAVPASMGVSAAREMVGQPFLADHTYATELKSSRATGGPVHLIACHKGVTEAQAMKVLGFPDATIISTSFGVYVADDVQKIQLVFLKNCRNPTATRHAMDRLLTWLNRAGESQRLAGRAESRLRIVAAIAAELPDN